MVTPFIALAVLLSPSPKTVTLTVAAAPVPDVVKQIADATGADLRVASGLAEIRVGVRLQGVPLETVKVKLAEALRAEWKPEDTGLRLVAPSGAAAVAARAAEIQAHFDRQPPLVPFGVQEAENLVRDALRAEADPSSRRDQQRLRALDMRVPSSRAAARIARAIGAQRLAGLRDGDRVVYSSDPTPRQRRMPPAMVEAMVALDQEATVYREALVRLAPPQNGPPDPAFRALETGGLGSSEDGPPALVLVVVIRWRGIIGIEFQTYDGEGNMRSLGSNQIDVGYGGRRMPGVREILQGSEAVYEPTETAKAFAAVSPADSGRPDGQAPATPADRARVEEVLTDLVKHEPLAWGIGDLARQAAENHGLNMVAVLPDRLASNGLILGVGGERTDARFNRSFTPVAEAVTVGDGWLIVREASDLIGGFSLPRREIGTFVRTTLATGRVQLDPLADLVGASPVDDEMGSTLRWPRFLFPDLSVSFVVERGGGLEALRMYSRLDPTARRLARGPDGVTLRYGEMRPRVRSEVDRLLFWPDWGRNFSREPANFESNEFTGVLRTLATEPTVAFGGGVSPLSTLTVRVRDRATLYARRPAPDAAWWSPLIATPRQIAEDLTRTEAPWYDPENMLAHTPYNRFAMGSMEQLEVAGFFGEGLHMGLRFRLPTPPADDAWVGLDGLPESVRKEIQDSVEAYRKRYREMRQSGQGPGSTGGARPPAP